MYESFIIFEPNNDKTLPSKNKIDNYIILDILDEERNLVFKNITMAKKKAVKAKTWNYK